MDLLLLHLFPVLLFFYKNEWQYKKKEKKKRKNNPIYSTGIVCTPPPRCRGYSAPSSLLRKHREVDAQGPTLMLS